jgi:hypothetical protein
MKKLISINKKSETKYRILVQWTWGPRKYLFNKNELNFFKESAGVKDYQIIDIVNENRRNYSSGSWATSEYDKDGNKTNKLVYSKHTDTYALSGDELVKESCDI